MSFRWENVETVYQLLAGAPHHLLGFNFVNRLQFSSPRFVNLWVFLLMFTMNKTEPKCVFVCLYGASHGREEAQQASRIHSAPSINRHETGPKIGSTQSDQKIDRHSLVPEKDRGGTLFTCAIKLYMLTSVTSWQWLRFSGSLQLNPDSGLWTGTLLSCNAWRAGSQGSGKRNVII